MPVFTPDLVFQVAEEVLQCVCDALTAESTCVCPCRMYVSAGPPAWDDCCEGQLTVHADRIYVHDNFPSGASSPHFCQSPLAGDFTVTLMRCAPTVKDDGSAPTPAELAQSSLEVYSEMYIAHRAILCCLAEARRHRKFLMRDARVVGPQGGCVGFTIGFTVELHDPPPP